MPSDKPYVRPDVQAFIAALEAMDRPNIATLNLDDARQGYVALHGLADRPARELAVIRDISYPGPAGDIPLRLYDAREVRDPGPVIVFFHGGGYVVGDLDTHNNLCTEIAHQMDLPVVAVDYRCAPEHPFPAPVDDCEAAARWIASSPGDLGRKATGLIAVGDSAGGNATIVVTQQLTAKPAQVPVILQVPIFPMASDIVGLNSIEEFAEGFILTKETMEFFFAAYQPDLDDPRAMPVLGKHEGTPPSIVVTAGLDPLRDSGRMYAAALAQAGVDHLYLEMKGATHSFTNLRQAVPSYQNDLENIFAAMKMMLGMQA